MLQQQFYLGDKNMSKTTNSKLKQSKQILEQKIQIIRTKIQKMSFKQVVKIIILQIPFFLFLLLNLVQIKKIYQWKYLEKQPTLTQNIIFRSTKSLDFSKKQQIQDEVTAVFTSSRRYDLLNATLKSFFIMNQYPIKQIIVIDDQYMNQQFAQFKEQFPNITWISTNRKVGQLYSIDIMYSLITTQYYFHSQDDWEYIRPGFIEKSLKVLKLHPFVSQTLLHTINGISSSEREGILLVQQFNYTGLSFNPSLHRLAQYQQIVKEYGSYSSFTHYASFGVGAGMDQFWLSLLFVKKGYKTYSLKENYLIHLGRGRGLDKLY